MFSGQCQGVTAVVSNDRLAKKKSEDGHVDQQKLAPFSGVACTVTAVLDGMGLQRECK